MTSGTDPRQTRSFRFLLLLARLVVTFERLWPGLWPGLAVVGVFVVLSLFGLWLHLPLALHLPLLGLFAAALAWTLWRTVRLLSLASRDAGLARLETDSGTKHQPLRALADTLPESFSDPATRRLWALHRERLIASLRRLRLAPPRSDLPRRDPWALRAALLLVLVVALVHARDDIGPRLTSAFTFTGRSAAATLPPIVDLWITPPAYTRKPPLVSEQTRGQASLTVPAGSEARVQVHHLPTEATAQLVFGDGRTPFTALGPGSGEAKLMLGTDGLLGVVDGAGREIARWSVDAVPDAAPSVRFAGTPKATHRGVLKIDLEAEDDHGVAELALLLAPVGREGEVERLLLLKPGSQPPKLEIGTYQDLTPHPLAGLPVKLQLEAVDAIGQKGRSEPLEIVLPAREFRHPLAKAVIEERRRLAGAPDSAMNVAGRLAALAETRAAQEQPIAVPLTLRSAASRLALNESDAASRRSVIDMLWELALFIEDGSLSVAERKLRDIQQELQKALEEGARDSELERLMEELQKAMDEFLEELARQAMEQGQPPPQDLQPLDQSQVVDRRDLQQMLDRARELLKSGARDAARDMLAQLQEMLENLRAGQQQARRPSQGEQALSDLQKMIQLQQNLLERSFQMNREQGQEGQPQPRGQRGQPQQGLPGQQQRGQGQDPMGQAQAEQEALRRALGELMRRMGEAGMEIPRALGQAEMQMRGARDALGEGEPGVAAEAQTQAVDAMQRAGQAMMEQLQEQMARQQGEGPGGQPQPTGRRGRDPLGRAARNDGGMDTHGVQVPEESDLGRARDVLEELYRRSGDRRRPALELDYYRRLLDRF
ncbi:TIGR02302 family protein [Benzoatithermus flavus]|uniref:TIGR02302 family protein n=1 Tax=Benzoatithermus flavus TaxID=3108223 RepID=A0ABU8XQA2_9PROT